MLWVAQRKFAASLSRCVCCYPPHQLALQIPWCSGARTRVEGGAHAAKAQAHSTVGGAQPAAQATRRRRGARRSGEREAQRRVSARHARLQPPAVQVPALQGHRRGTVSPGAGGVCSSGEERQQKVDSAAGTQMLASTSDGMCSCLGSNGVPSSLPALVTRLRFRCMQ